MAPHRPSSAAELQSSGWTTRERILGELLAHGVTVPDLDTSARFVAVARLTADYRPLARAFANLEAALRCIAHQERGPADGRTRGTPVGQPGAPVLEVLDEVRLEDESRRRAAAGRQHAGHERGAAYSTALTTRQREVAGLIARGLTNKQIARSLIITEKTVGTHVEDIFNKLGFQSRAQVAAWVGMQGMPVRPEAHAMQHAA
jgi:DNA-binding NarL/FixJ family response regulator